MSTKNRECEDAEGVAWCAQGPHRRRGGLQGAGRACAGGHAWPPARCLRAQRRAGRQASGGGDPSPIVKASRMCSTGSRGRQHFGVLQPSWGPAWSFVRKWLWARRALRVTLRDQPFVRPHCTLEPTLAGYLTSYAQASCDARC